MTAKDCAMIASRMGDVEAVSSSGLTMRLEKVLHLPQLSENLLSISKITDRGYTTIFTAGCVIVTKEKVQFDTNKVILWGERKRNLYEVAIHERGCSQVANGSQARVAEAENKPIEMSQKEFHERMNHLNHGDIDWLEWNGKLNDVKLIPIADTPKNELECEVCILGKHLIDCETTVPPVLGKKSIWIQVADRWSRPQRAIITSASPLTPIQISPGHY